jgi:hypothetical protein
MTDSPRAGLPLLATSQASKEITHNEALFRLEALCVGSALSATTTTPPTTPLEGDVYIVPTSSTGIWSSKANFVAHFYNSAWSYYAPSVGWHFLSLDDRKTRLWDGSSWLVIYLPI